MVGIPGDREVGQHVRRRGTSQSLMQGESAFSQLQCRLDHLRETERAKAFQSGKERIGSGARPGSQHPGKGNEGDLVLLELVNRSGSRGNCITVNGKNFLILGAVNERRDLSAKGVHMWVQYPFSQGGGDRRVKGVAPGL